MNSFKISVDSSVSELIKCNLLSFDKVFSAKRIINGKRLYYQLSLTDTNRVEFFAKVFGHELPCCSWYVNRKTKLSDLEFEISKRV